MSHQDNYVICRLLYTAGAGMNLGTDSRERAFCCFSYGLLLLECGINPLLDAILHLRADQGSGRPCLLEGDALEIPVLNSKPV